MIYLFGILLMFGALGDARSTACSYENRMAVPDDCIERIRDAMTNVDLFWFGNGYASRCPQELAFTVDCFNPITTTDNSLASLVFWPGFYHGSSIVKFLNVTFTSPPGSYEGCNTRYERPSPSLTFTLDPLSDEVVEPWDVREQPEVTWEADPDKLYTLMFKDVGFGFMHGLFINIPGMDISRAEVIFPYSGPKNFRVIPNPYIFLLFEQSQHITMDDLPPLSPNFPTPMNVSYFTFQSGLTGPVAVNWLLADYDPYSVEYSRPTGILENCSPFVTEALEDRNLTYASPSQTLPVFMTVAAHTDAITVDYCCTSETFPEQTVVLDPVTSAFVEPALVRSGATFNITLSSNRIFPNRTANFLHRYYSLMVVEPDSPAPQAVEDRPLLRWLAINMAAPGGQLGVGVDVVPYLAPLPSDPDMDRYYYFLLYEQPNGALELVNDTGRYTKDTCGADLEGRCQFDVTSFLETHALTLVAASWFTSRRTDYVSVQTGLPQAEGCAGRPGYSNPCNKRPTSGSLARQVAPALPVLLLVVAWCVLVSQPIGPRAY